MDWHLSCHSRRRSPPLPLPLPWLSGPQESRPGPRHARCAGQAPRMTLTISLTRLPEPAPPPWRGTRTSLAVPPHAEGGSRPLCFGRETALPLSAYPPPRDSSMAGRVFLALAGACKFCTVWAGLCLIHHHHPWWLLLMTDPPRECPGAAPGHNGAAPGPRGRPGAAPIQAC